MWIFLFGDHFQLKPPSVNRYRDKSFREGFRFCPIQLKINELELRRDFNEFCRRMLLKWYFRMSLKVLMKHQILRLNQNGI